MDIDIDMDGIVEPGQAASLRSHQGGREQALQWTDLCAQRGKVALGGHTEGRIEAIDS